MLFNDKIDKAKILNDQFTSVFTQEDGNAIPTLKGDKFPSIDELTKTSERIEKLLRDLKPNKAPVPDSVPARFLKETATEFAPALSAFSTQSLNEATLPKDWSQANITPIYKKGSRYQPENYRPVSLTCICRKVMEHVISSNPQKSTAYLQCCSRFQTCEIMWITTTGHHPRYAQLLEQGSQTSWNTGASVYLWIWRSQTLRTWSQVYHRGQS